MAGLIDSSKLCIKYKEFMVDSSFVRVSGHHLLSAAAEEQAEQRQQSKWVKNAQGILTRKLCVVFTSYNLECEHT